MHNASDFESSNRPANPVKQSFWWTVLVAVIAISVAIGGLGESLWLDELHTSWCISGDWADILPRAQAGNQTPAFMWLEYLVCWTLGGTEVDSPGNMTTGDVPSGNAFESSVRLIQTEWWLRLPSLIAFAACASVLVAYLGSRVGLENSPQIQTESSERDSPSRFASSVSEVPPTERRTWLDGLLVAAIVVGWFVWDRIQLFYATEARVYGLLQLVNLLSWLCVIQYATQRFRSRADEGNEGTKRWYLTAWVILSVVSVNLHLTIVLHIVFQSLVLLLLSALSVRRLAAVTLAVLVSAIGCAPALWIGVPVWERRTQWQSFAGDASGSVLWNMFPFGVVFFLPMTFWLVDVCAGGITKQLVRVARTHGLLPRSSRIVKRWETGSTKNKTALATLQQGDQQSVHHSNETHSAWIREASIWAVAVVGPLAAAWSLTFLEIAPLMHRRYVLGCSLPLLILGGLLTLQIRFRALRALAVVAVFVVLVTTQGTWQVWQSGAWVGWQRGEDWKRAANWVESRIGASDEIWCASGLIEADRSDPPWDADFDAYLSFPLRGIYRIDRQDIREPAVHALASDAGLWLSQWFAKKPAAVLSEDSPLRAEAKSYFLVCRTSPEVLMQILSGLQTLARENGVQVFIEAKPIGFGSVCAAEVRLGVVGDR